MTLFFICSALLVLLSVGWLLLGLFKADELSTDQEAVNITLARERRETLDVALAEAAIDQATYDYELEQLEHELAAGLTLENTTKHRGGQVGAAVLVCAFIPIAAGALYLHLGNPAAITQPRNASANVTADTTANAAAMADMLPQMEERLAQTPEDINGWRLLGRSYLSIGDFAGARRAFEKALALNENDAPTMTQLAEAIAMTQQGDLSGEPLTLVSRANALDPDHEHAIWLLAIARQQAGDHTLALEGFDRLVGMAAGNPEALATIEQMRSNSVAALTDITSREGSASLSTGASSDASVLTPSDQTTDNSPSLSVTVDLSEKALNAVDGQQIVFVYAVATQGPPMPLAVSRLTVNDLPATVTLDNSMAMIPNMTLSAFASVNVGARISTTGNAIAQSGDWFAEATDVETDSTREIKLFIDTQKP